jgi:betaine-aldehyde dehydrogenase
MTILETAVLELKNYIDGKWQASSSNEVIPVINPATQEIIAKAPRATKEDTERAISVAKAAFESGIWSGLTAQERASYLYKIADKIDERAEELTILETMDNGKPLLRWFGPSSRRGNVSSSRSRASDGCS